MISLADRKPWRDAALLATLLGVCSFREIAKYVPGGAVKYLLFLLLAFVIYWLAIRRLLLGGEAARKLSWWLTGLLLLATVLAVEVIYPIADARRSIGGGGTADDAVIMAVMSWLSGTGMYESVLPGGVPISPGPGWIMVISPLLSVFNYQACILFFLFVFAACLYRVTGRVEVLAFVLIVLAMSVLFWQLLLTGHDLVWFSLLIALLPLWSYRLVMQPAGLREWLLFAVVVGVLATARIVLLVLPLVFSVFLWRVSVARTIVFATLATGISLGLHGYFYEASTVYQPLHLVGRGESKTGHDMMMLGGIAFLFMLHHVWRVRTDAPHIWVMQHFLLLFCIFSAISLGELRAVDWSFSQWEGANYLFPCLPLLMLAIALKYSPGAVGLAWRSTESGVAS